MPPGKAGENDFRRQFGFPRCPPYHAGSPIQTRSPGNGLGGHKAQVRDSNSSDEPRKSAKTVPAVQRAVSILWFLARQKEPRSLAQVARGTGTVPSTALHILRELEVTRIVTIDRALKLYSLGPGLVELSQMASSNFNLLEVVRPKLHDIAYRHRLTSTATTILDDAHATCVTSVSPPDATSINVTPGGRVPKFSGAAGRCFAAFSQASRKELKGGFDKIRWQEPFGFEAWLAEIEDVRKLGYAQDIGQFSKGVTSLAVPVFSTNGEVNLVIGISTISAALDKTTTAMLIDDLISGAGAIAHHL